MVRITIGKVKLSKRWPAFLMWELQWFARQIDEFDVWEVLQPINLCCRAQTGPTQWRMVGERVNLFSLRCTKTWYQDVYGVPSKNDWKGVKRLKGYSIQRFPILIDFTSIILLAKKTTGKLLILAAADIRLETQPGKMSRGNSRRQATGHCCTIGMITAQGGVWICQDIAQHIRNYIQIIWIRIYIYK